eukprot:m.37855 g.37855  ORF g.37855 m.37855 type:complete len:355 (-) comp45130_c0_seq7:244-1308(-)
MRLSKLKLKLNQDKCFFFQQSCEYLGHLVSRDGVAPSPGKVEALLSVEPPSDLSSLRAFLGLVGYYRRFVPNFAALAAPLFGLLKKDVAFVMGPQQIAACEALKAAVAQGNVLAIPDVSKPFKLYTDASDLAVGAVLEQDYDDGPRPVVFLSKALTPAERRYTTSEKELLAIVFAIKRLRHYLYGHRFLVFTDHSALQWLRAQVTPTGRLSRWCALLQEFDFEVSHVPGRDNVVADGLSRLPAVPSSGAMAASEESPSLSVEVLLAEQQADPDIQGIRQFLRGEKQEPPQTYSGMVPFLFIDDYDLVCFQAPSKQPAAVRWLAPQSIACWHTSSGPPSTPQSSNMFRVVRPATR